MVPTSLSNYEVRLGTSRAVGWIVIALSSLCIVGALLRHQYGAAVGFFVFVLIGFLAIATGGSILISDTSVEQRSAFGRYRIAWSDVRRVEVGNAGTIVLHGQNKRFALMPPGYWSGSQKPGAVALLQERLKALEATVYRTNVGDYKIHKNVRVVDR
jgi:Bacterial PH domain